MNLREALINQAPSLPLQRAAADEIARLDAQLDQIKAQQAMLMAAHEAVKAERDDLRSTIVVVCDCKRKETP